MPAGLVTGNKVVAFVELKRAGQGLMKKMRRMRTYFYLVHDGLLLSIKVVGFTA